MKRFWKSKGVTPPSDKTCAAWAGTRLAFLSPHLLPLSFAKTVGHPMECTKRMQAAYTVRNKNAEDLAAEYILVFCLQFLSIFCSTRKLPAALELGNMVRRGERQAFRRLFHVSGVEAVQRVFYGKEGVASRHVKDRLCYTTCDTRLGFGELSFQPIYAIVIVLVNRPLEETVYGRMTVRALRLYLKQEKERQSHVLQLTTGLLHAGVRSNSNETQVLESKD